jgi:hypothetical protein
MNKIWIALFVSLVLAGVLFWSAKIVLASTTDGTIDSVYKYAWGKNIGWVNFGTTGGNVHVTDSALTGYAWSENYGWINLNPTKSGVTNDGAGTLSGYAWGENLGWINFNGVTINSSGIFTGSASGDVSGQISFDCSNCTVKTDWRPQSVRPHCGDGSCNNGETCSTCSADCGNCGGGGGGGGGQIITQVILSGKAYPLSKVTVLKDGQIAVNTIAGLDANFSVALTSLSAGDYVFSVYSEDNKGRRSSLFTFPVTVVSGSTVKITGIFLSPTIDVDKSEVKRGDNIAILGQSVPNGEITIAVNSEQELFVKSKADKEGIYLYNLDTSPLDLGQHSTKSKAAADGLISSFSASVGFLVSTQTVAKAPVKCPLRGDLNNDCRVNLVDFSIAAYWYKRPISDTFKVIEKQWLNGDGKISLVDFSIIAYYWTG